MSLPDVFAYLDYRAFLRDWFEARKRENPEFSYAQFASDGGCSRGALPNVITGARTPRPSTLDAFARAMGLEPIQRDYLGLLVELATAADLDARHRAMEKILSVERFRQVRYAERHPDQDIARYLEHWSIPVIREMVSLPGFREDPEWIASVTRPPIEPERAARALETLLDLGFVTRAEDGRLVRSELQFRTEPDAFQGAVHRFYREELTRLIGGLRIEHGVEQHLLTATVTLDPVMIPEAKAMLNKVMEQLTAMADASSQAGPKRVYQASVVVMPLTETLD